MIRTVVFLLALIFILGFAFLTVLDIARYGLTGVSVIALVILLLLGVGILGALRPPRRQ